MLQPHADVREEDVVMRRGLQRGHAGDDARVEVPQDLGPQLKRQSCQHLLNAKAGQE